MSDHKTNTTIHRLYDATTPEGLAFALLGCLNFGKDGKSGPTFRPEAIDLITEALKPLHTLGQITIEQAQELSRHRVALIGAFQVLNQCSKTGHRCSASECKCCQDYEDAVHV